MNPIPRGHIGDQFQTGKSFAPRCAESAACGPSSAQETCRCSGDGETGLGNLEIVDQLLLPKSLKAGKWLLGWRWDCEESNQIWQSCSDITITA